MLFKINTSVFLIMQRCFSPLCLNRAVCISSLRLRLLKIRGQFISSILILDLYLASLEGSKIFCQFLQNHLAFVIKIQIITHQNLIEQASKPNIIKLGLSRKHTKFEKNLPHGFDKSADLLSKRQNHEEDFFQIICASQKVRTLLK